MIRMCRWASQCSWGLSPTTRVIPKITRPSQPTQFQPITSLMGWAPKTHKVAPVLAA